MRVGVLLSGGKDSVAALDVARGHAWDVVVALVLVPAQDDAWMFHVPNIRVAEGIGEALGVPVQVAEVRSGPAEELEDLEAAVRSLQEVHALDGIVSGALASEYQRTRIDAIGHRLGLKTFAPLWHVNPGPYFRGLLDAGYDIRLVRAAADGLDAGWLERPLTIADLDELATRRLHVAGEGGEFETIVLDGPHHLKRLLVEASAVVESSTRSTWNIERYQLVAKEPPAEG